MTLVMYHPERDELVLFRFAPVEGWGDLFQANGYRATHSLDFLLVHDVYEVVGVL